MKNGCDLIHLKSRCRKSLYFAFSLYLLAVCFFSLSWPRKEEKETSFRSRKLLGGPSLIENVVYSHKRQKVGTLKQTSLPPDQQKIATPSPTVQQVISKSFPPNQQETSTPLTPLPTIQTTSLLERLTPPGISSTPNDISPTQIPESQTTTVRPNTTKTPEKSSCEPPSLAEFPADLFTQQQRRNGAFLVHLFVALYMFAALAIVCDYYFVPSLEVICAKLKLQTDVAGASLMAIGSSAPELFASLIGAFVTKGDIGIGTILGSAVFNVLFVLGLCGVLSTQELNLAWWPVLRDGLSYAFSLVVLTLVIFDGTIRWKEAFLMLVIYFLYLIAMYKNRKIEKWFYLYLGDKKSYEERFETMESAFEDTKEGEEGQETIEDTHYHSPSEVQKSEEDEYMQVKSEDSETSTEDSDEEIYPTDPPRELLAFPSRHAEIYCWILTFPINAIFYFSIPDIRRKNLRHFVSLTFVMSIFWIGVSTYFLVWMVTIIGFTVRIPDAVMGLTLIAFGSSLPDALASILVARQGKGDMAVAQAIGSNVFDVLLGLGLPWLIKIIFDSESVVRIQSVGMIMSCFFIFLAVIGVLAILYYYDFRLSRKLGWILILAYVIFLVLSVLLELFVWSQYHLPTCKTL